MMLATSYKKDNDMLEGTTTMELVFCVSMVLASNHPAGHSFQAASAQGSQPGLSPPTGTQSIRKRQSGKKRRAKKSQKATPAKSTPVDPQLSPVLDTPNRMEIDPGDIPPSQPRNPDEDDRTKIPDNIDPGDRVPPSSIPKPKKPRPTSNELEENAP